MLLSVVACEGARKKPVAAADYDAFWLWAGVTPTPALRRAKTLYILEGEVTAQRPGTLSSLRAGIPRTGATELWMVVRVETLRWQDGVDDAMIERLASWRKAGNRVAGLQIDFDARTRHLDEYAAFLADLRRRLPRTYRLGVTGLLDWSANGNPRALAKLTPVVDEVVLQTYQGRSTIPGYRNYLNRLDAFPIAFRIGIVEGGEWSEPASLRADPKFKGYVVFLLNAAKRDDQGRVLRH